MSSTASRLVGPCERGEMALVLPAALLSGWTTISQARFGAQIAGVQQFQHGNWSYEGPAAYQRGKKAKNHLEFAVPC